VPGSHTWFSRGVFTEPIQNRYEELQVPTSMGRLAGRLIRSASLTRSAWGSSARRLACSLSHGLLILVVVLGTCGVVMGAMVSLLASVMSSSGRVSDAVLVSCF